MENKNNKDNKYKLKATKNITPKKVLLVGSLAFASYKVATKVIDKTKNNNNKDLKWY